MNMSSGAVVLAWLRLDLRRRWRSLLVLTLLIVIAGATVMASLAGARRGASSLQRLESRTLPATVAVLANTLGFDWSKIRALPEIASLSTFVVDYGYVYEGLPGEVGAFPPGDDQTMRTLERPVVYAGRVFDPTRDDEVVVSRQFVANYHKGVGDTLVLDLPTAKQLSGSLGPSEGVTFDGPHLRMRIVGVVSSPWFSDQTGSKGAVVMSPGVAALHPENVYGNLKDPNNSNFVNALIRLHGGEAAIARLSADITKITGRSDIDVMNLPEQARAEQRDIAFEARCLVAFAIAAFAAALFLVGQAIARYAAASVAELQTMQALGMTPRQAIVTATSGPALTGVFGGVLAGVGAYIASHWTPIGAASLIEPTPGVTWDWVVLGPGIAVILLLVGAAATGAAWFALGASRRGAPVRRSVVAAAVARLGLPVPAVVGTRFALESGRGRNAVPVRPALIGAVAGVLGILAAFTFSHAVSDAASKPERFGQTYQLDSFVGINGQDFAPPKVLLSALAANKDVTGVDDARTAVATGPDGRGSVSLYAYGGGGKPLPLVVTSGRMAQAPDEVVLGPKTLTALHAKVGKRVILAGNKHATSYLVTGAGFVPEGPHNGYADGGWVTQSGYDSIFSGFKFHIVLVELAPGLRGPDAAATLGTAMAKIDPALKDAFEAPDVTSEIAVIRQVRVLPILLGCFLALLAIGAVGHALATAVRRRSHDLAVLRALGMTQWQSRWVTVTQATVVAVIGLVFGVPLGIAVGRSVWRAVADYTPLEYVPPLAIWALALVGPGVLLISTLLAAWPGHRAARLRVATILRAE
jgi:hypothetical protein